MAAAGESPFGPAMAAHESGRARHVTWADEWGGEGGGPRLTKVLSRPATWSLYKRDAGTLGGAFLLVFMAFSATQNLESSLNRDEGLGSLSLGLLYSCLTFFSFGAPAVVRRLGAKNSMLFGLSGYWLYVAANLLPSWYTLVPASIYLGFCASILWVAQGAYLSFVAKGHAGLCHLSEEATIGSFNGQFWSLFAANQVLGNVVVLVICLLLEHSSVDPSHVSSSTQRILFGVLLLSLTVGTVLVFFIRNQSRRQVLLVLGEEGGWEEEEEGEEGGEGGEREGGGAGKLLKEAVALLGERKMVFLVPLLIYSGLQQAFIWNDFTASLVAPTLGVAWIGGVMAIYGLSDAVSSAVAGRLSAGERSIAAIVSVGAAGQAVVVGALLLGRRQGGGFLFLAAALWGVGDGAFNSQLSALLAIRFPAQTEAAFAQWKVWQSASTAAMFYVAPFAGFQVKVITLAVTLVASMASFYKGSEGETELI